MVMHARKLPRLNDGYADRKDSHLHQNMPYQSKSFGGVYSNKYDRDDDRSSDDGSGSRNSSRYQNKSSYIERNKEKRGSVSMSETKSNHQVYGVSTSSRGGGSSQGNSSGGPHNHQDRYSKSTVKESKDQRGGGGGDKDHRVEVQKSAVRVFGDWSEHISSSGKRYYYNCRTEVSQWEKPKECTESPRTPDSSRTKESRTPIKSSHPSSSSRTVDDRCKHSTSDREKMDSRYSRINSETSVRHSDKPQSDRHKTVYPGDSPNYNSSHRTSTSQRNNSISDTANSHKDNSTLSDVRKNTSHSYASNEPALRRQRHESEGSRSSFGHTTPQKNDESTYVHTDSMDISPGSTPTGTRQGSKPSCTAALQTLQKLQEALNLHINRAQQMAQNVQPQHQQQQQQHQQHQQQSKQLSSPQQIRQPVPHLGNNIQGPPLSSQHPEQNDNGSEHQEHHSPLSDMSPTWSPTHSTNQLQTATVTSALSGAIIKKEQSVELTPSLSNYYNEKLVGHVFGWQAEHVERQAHLYRDEGLTVGSLQCSRVSVELKKDRSLVRTAEIQSTLHEQRILFLDKQISEIDSLKTPSTFLPS